MSNYSSEDEEMKENISSDEELQKTKKKNVNTSSVEQLEVAPLKEDKSNLMWIEKYRPESLSEIISHEHIIQTSLYQCKST